MGNEKDVTKKKQLLTQIEQNCNEVKELRNE